MWMDEKKQLISDAKAGGCKLCGEDDPSCLEFHHIDPATKKYNISRMILTRVGVKAVKQELAKCICICANCHMKTHAGNISIIRKGG